MLVLAFADTVYSVLFLIGHINTCHSNFKCLRLKVPNLFLHINSAEHKGKISFYILRTLNSRSYHHGYVDSEEILGSCEAVLLPYRTFFGGVRCISCCCCWGGGSLRRPVFNVSNQEKCICKEMGRFYKCHESVISCHLYFVNELL